MESSLTKQLIRDIERELIRISRETPTRCNDADGMPWQEEIVDKVIHAVDSIDEPDEVAEEIHNLRIEQGEPLFSMTIQAMHDDEVSYSAWTLPSGTTAYLCDSWHTDASLIAIDETGFSDEKAAEHLSRHFRSAYFIVDPERDGPGELIVSPLMVEVELKTRTPEIDALIAAGEM